MDFVWFRSLIEGSNDKNRTFYSVLQAESIKLIVFIMIAIQKLAILSSWLNNFINLSLLYLFFTSQIEYLYNLAERDSTVEEE